MHGRLSNGRRRLEDGAPDHGNTDIGHELELALLEAYHDKVAAWVVREFDAAGIDSILLKGAALARLLYDAAGERPYGDVDLLVPVGSHEIAADLLRSRGFIRVDRDADWLSPAPMYAHTFRRPIDGALVDLHWTMGEFGASPEKVWAVLRRHTVELPLEGQSVTALDTPATALVVALHNAHHGTERPLTLTDLDRAVERLEFGTWLEAKELAERLDARDMFAAGLRLTASGGELADRLGLERPLSTEMWLKTNPRSHAAWVVDCFSRTHTLRGRLAMTVKVVAPPPTVMRLFFPLAKRGPLGLVAAYLLRPVRLIVNAPSALTEWIRARRDLKRNHQLTRSTSRTLDAVTQTTADPPTRQRLG